MMLVEQRLSNDKKSTVVAYLLWLFLGGMGAHRFYLGRAGTAMAQLILFVLGWLTLVVATGGLLLAVWGIWILVDAFLIPGMIEADTREKRAQILSDLSVMAIER